MISAYEKHKVSGQIPATFEGISIYRQGVVVMEQGYFITGTGYQCRKNLGDHCADALL